MNDISLRLFTMIKELIDKESWKNEDINLLLDIVKNDWIVSFKEMSGLSEPIRFKMNNTKDNSLFRKKLVISRYDFINRLDITFVDNKISIFFIHKNDSIDRRVPSNSYLFNIFLTKDKLDKLEDCLNKLDNA